MGLVAVGSGERARVTGPTPPVPHHGIVWRRAQLLATPDGMRHFQEARTQFEVVIAQLAARRSAAAGTEALARALAENEAALGDLGRFERTDVAFTTNLPR